MGEIRTIEGRCEGFEVREEQGKKLGRTSGTFVDTSDGEEYLSVEVGFLGRESVLIPARLVRVNEVEKSAEVKELESRVKEAPGFRDDGEVAPGLIIRTRNHFGLGGAESEKYRDSAAHIEQVQREEGTGRAPKSSEDVDE